MGLESALFAMKEEQRSIALENQITHCINFPRYMRPYEWGDPEAKRKLWGKNQRLNESFSFYLNVFRNSYNLFNNSDISIFEKDGKFLKYKHLDTRQCS